MTNQRTPPGFEGFRPGAQKTERPGPQHVQPPPGPPRRRAGAQKKPKRKRSSGIGTVLLVIGVGMLALFGAALAFLMVAPPTDAIRDELVAQVKASTGRDLTIKGGAGLTFFPALGFSMGKVSLSAPPAMGGAPFVRMKRMTVQVKLLPLLSRKISIDSFILDAPVFDLRVDKQGRKSWEFAAHQAGAGHVQLAQADGRQGTMNDGPAAFGSPGLGGSSGASGGGFDVAALDQLELGDVRISDGTVGYTDEGSGTQERVEKINVTLGLKSIASPFTVKGNLRYKSEQIAFNSTLRSVKSILGQRPADLNATVQSAHLTGTYKGTIDVSNDLRLDGDVTAQSASVRALAKWLGTDLPPAKGFGPFSLQGRLKANGPVYNLANIKLGLDGATGDGNVTVMTNGPRPKVSGNLRLSELDLNKYMPAAGTADRRKAKKAKPGRKKPSSIEDLINRPGPRVQGYTKRAGWSREPIDFSALGAVDANLKLALGKLLYEKIKVGRSRMDVVLTNRALTAKLNDMELYSGTGRGVLTLNARQANAAMGANFNLNGVSAQPLLNDAAEINWLAGKGQLLLAVKSSGQNEQQIIKRLNGTASIAFEDGAIVGVNVPKTVRAIQQGRFTDLGGSPDEKTDFSQLTASFNIQKGIAVNNDLKMQSPLLRVTGEGKVMLPKRRVDYTVKPKVVASLSGQGGDQSTSGLEIPVRVHGPFEDLSYTPDFKGLLKDPGKAADTVRELGRKYGGEEAGKVLDSLLGGGNNKDGKGVDTKKLLDGFLGGR
jgi:AsmA protein